MNKSALTKIFKIIKNFLATMTRLRKLFNNTLKTK
jgi:hypothetical protein